MDFVDIQIQESDLIEFKRLDQFLCDKLPEMSRSYIKLLFSQGNISISESSSNQNIKLELKKMPPVGIIITVEIPPPIPSTASAENIPLEILFEDEHLVFVNKPVGMVTHPAPGNYSGTLVNAILHHCPDIQGIGNEIRPGIVHRLDKGTGGVMVVAKTQKCHEGLVNLFSSHDLTRKYEALTLGSKISPTGTLKSVIGRDPKNRLKMSANVTRGRTAITHYKVINFYNNISHIELKLETGRTHQIRVHLSSLLKSPILCDSMYANVPQQLQRIDNRIKSILKNYPHPLLHAKSLGLIHPITKKELHFEVEAPKIFLETLELGKKLFNE